MAAIRLGLARILRARVGMRRRGRWDVVIRVGLQPLVAVKRVLQVLCVQQRRASNTGQRHAALQGVRARECGRGGAGLTTQAADAVVIVVRMVGLHLSDDQRVEPRHEVLVSTMRGSPAPPQLLAQLGQHAASSSSLQSRLKFGAELIDAPQVRLSISILLKGQGRVARAGHRTARSLGRQPDHGGVQRELREARTQRWALLNRVPSRRCLWFASAAQ